MTTMKEAYLQASSFLEKQGVPEAASCAELLLQHLMGWSRTAFLLNLEEPFPEERHAEWTGLLARKAAGEPVQYIIGEQEFYGLPFAVDPSVLIPRPETELLVEEMIRRGRRLWPDAGTDSASTGGSGCAPAPVAADIGAGSGAICVTLAVQCPAWQVHAVDLSSAALQTARRNAERLGADRIVFHHGDLLEPLITSRIAVDILVSNPPYIPSGEVLGLQREVAGHEPHSALDGGPDGLDLYRRMVRQLEELPRYPRLIGLEVGMGQAEAVRELLQRSGPWREIVIVPDLAGIGRHVVAEA
ncbi:release factor glutamine methyltransferase [Paenibacillus sp. J31TS4]|uniref:peptide chain release factor N(5)-glutamine methyltransferase n=1 Tax=Paenibacillus sp. J31TS4 TaxID=2807195 RepID=UPI001B1CC1BA|nr:peptide chain release factor N(5)-glutamine methyltransferase [Paenibacillus sp. J31TS4]GIP40924.1 release factor glutamine methyltransferase [Paenibacillus sp. J31TS4]